MQLTEQCAQAFDGDITAHDTMRLAVHYYPINFSNSQRLEGGAKRRRIVPFIIWRFEIWLQPARNQMNLMT